MKIAVVMDPISNIDFKKDSTLLLIYEAQKRNHDVFYIESNNLFFDGNEACALSSKIKVKMDRENWFSLDDKNKILKKYQLFGKKNCMSLEVYIGDYCHI